MYLIFDTETTGLPKFFNAPITDTDNWPRCIQIAWQLHDEYGRLIEHKDYLVKPKGFDIPYDSEQVHGISTHLANNQGVELDFVLTEFNKALEKTKFIIGHNIEFDLNIMGCEFYRKNHPTKMLEMPFLDTKTEETANLVQIPSGKKFKWPTLSELYEYLFKESFAEAHNATADVEATTRCFLELVRRGIYSVEELKQPQGYIETFQRQNPEPFQLIGLKHVNLKSASEKIRKQLESAGLIKESIFEVSEEDIKALETASFSHLHNHSQFSVLQSTISVKRLVDLASNANMPAVAMTDHGNMMGAFQFVSAALDYNKKIEAVNKEAIENGEEPTKKILKPIVGCEFYVCENHEDKTKKDNGYQMVILAKNKKGYHNLAKMASIASTKGFYYVPRIDKNIIAQYKEDLIVLSGGLQGEIAYKILNIGEKQAEEALLWWKEQFGEDFYIEIMRHGQDDEDRVNKTLIQFSQKHQVKLIAANNTYYASKNEANAHDILLCVKDGEKQATPIGRGRGYRFGMPNQEYYFKTAEEMKSLFKDLPQAILNISEVVDKIEIYSLHRDVLLPKFDIPEEFQFEEDKIDGGKRGENNYLKYLTYEGAKKRYGTITEEVTERLDFELQTIEKTGYPGYFLIVQDFIAAAREMGVSVGPGRGSAAGSAVAYCLGITNIDPIKYDLLFERFLNPDRVSMPDIDIDFDDEGRASVMQYVIDKYGQNQVAQIITYGKMATKSSIKDAARVLDLPLSDSDRLAKLIPNMMPSKWNLARFLSEPEEEVKKALKSDEFEPVKELINIAKGDNLEAEIIQQAKIIEGSMRNTGVHACGVIITPDDITNFVPVTTVKDSDLYLTQFDNSVAESAGLLKMDFLGLKTLTIIKDACKLVKDRKGIELNPDEFPIDDVKTYELFQRGETVGVFQYESPGMQKYMRELKPTVFADLIAMNALYRPGPLEYIPSFILRKHGLEPIVYDLDECEEYLKETYGITVYQEQVMLLSQKLANFSKGDADVLRKAMGKKQKDVLDKMKGRFIEQAKANGHNEEKLEKIWKDWEAFAAYAFNKSHSTCYAWVAYQTAYLKAHYPAEFMAAVLSNNMNDLKQVTFFMGECKRMNINVLGPDVNESLYKFNVNDKNEIRFGMGAVKGVGEGAVNTIIENRKDGKYTSIFDMVKRIDLRAANKKAFENLANAGGFDCFEDIHRAQYFHIDSEGKTFLEKIMKYGAKVQEGENSMQVSLFGDAEEVQILAPVPPICDQWHTMEKLAREKDVVGIYITGHPLDDYRIEMENFCSTPLTILNDLSSLIGRTIIIGGMITDVQKRVNQKGAEWAIFTLQGFEDSCEFRIFSEEYLKYRHLLIPNSFVFMRLLIKEGWIDKKTGKRSEPKIQFLEIGLLGNMIENFSKNLKITIDVSVLDKENINKLFEIISNHKGNKNFYLEVIEQEEDKSSLYNTPNLSQENLSDEELETFDETEIMLDEPEIDLNFKVKQKLDFQSKNIFIDISLELLEELKLNNYKFSLN